MLNLGRKFSTTKHSREDKLAVPVSLNLFDYFLQFQVCFEKRVKSRFLVLAQLTIVTGFVIHLSFKH
jgi:hypothetical protein